MSTEELINAAKTVVTVLIGGALGKYGDKLIEWARGRKKDMADVDKTTTEGYKIQIETAIAMGRMEREEKMEYRKENIELRKQLRETFDLLYNEKKKTHDCERELDMERKKNRPPDDRMPDRNIPG